MKLYKVLHENGSIDTYDTLFDAYSAIDYDGVFLTLKEYVDVKWVSVQSCDEFISFIERLKTFSDLIPSQIQAKYNIQQLSDVYVLTTGSNNNANAKTLIVLNNDSFLHKFNSLISNLGYADVIEKNDEFIKDNLKHYFMNNIKTFLDVTDYLIVNNYYDSKWSRQILTDDQLTNMGIIKSSDFNSEDPYFVINDGEYCSMTQVMTLNHFINDIDNIIDIIFNNHSALATSNLDTKFLSYIS